MKAKGYFLAALAAALYGVNPAFVVPLYGAGMDAISILFFRYILGIPFLIALVLLRGEGIGLKKSEIVPVASLGLTMALSSLTLYESYLHMNPGIASTMLFMYPVLTALLMAVFFHEKFRLITGVCLFIMGCGLYLLMNPGASGAFSLTGFWLVFLSALTYAIYLVMIKVSPGAREIDSIKSLSWQLVFGSLLFAAIFFITPFTYPAAAFGWLNLVSLALLPTVLSLLCTMRAIACIGPTPTAIFGALEPVTAVILSIIVLHETITTKEIIGGILIMTSTIIVVISNKDS